eukprot:378933-Hanusia_phi.AAC.1
MRGVERGAEGRRGENAYSNASDLFSFLRETSTGRRVRRSRRGRGGAGKGEEASRRRREVEARKEQVDRLFTGPPALVFVARGRWLLSRLARRRGG